MLEAMTYQDMLSDINKNARKNGIINDTIGILITRAGSARPENKL